MRSTVYAYLCYCERSKVCSRCSHYQQILLTWINSSLLQNVALLLNEPLAVANHGLQPLIQIAINTIPDILIVYGERKQLGGSEKSFQRPLLIYLKQQSSMWKKEIKDAFGLSGCIRLCFLFYCCGCIIAGVDCLAWLKRQKAMKLKPVKNNRTVGPFP